MTLFVANLDCELEWSGAPPLPAPVVQMLAALGTLTRILADTVELLAPVPPSRTPQVRGTCTQVRGTCTQVRGTCTQVRGTCTQVPRTYVGDVTTWGATRRWGGDVETARRANDRRLAVEVAAALGERIGEVAGTMAEVEEAVARAGDAWVAKAMICAAGRDRVRRRGAIDAQTRVRLERLMARSGSLLIEPWLERVMDLGQPGEISDGGVTLAPPHRLICDEGGGFRGIGIGDGAAAGYEGDLTAAGRAAGAALARIGYRGKFVVDAFVYRTAAGLQLRPVVEINARWTFGWIARAWAEVLGPGVLEIGRGAPPAVATPLLLPGDDPTSAWFTSARSRSPAI